MTIRLIKYSAFIVLLLLIQGCSSTIKKSFEAYNRYDFYSAKQKFEKLTEKEKKASIGHYGLSLIYFQNNNPFHDPDSAYSHIKKSIAYFPHLKEKKREKFYEIANADSLTLDSLKEEIDHYFFVMAKEIDRVSAYQEFIDKHPNAKEVPKAIVLRDQLAYQEALSKNSSDALLSFIEKYPNTHLMEDAVKQYQWQLYNEKTTEGNIKSYITFLEKYPGNPHAKDAEDQIYRLHFSHHNSEEYENFIEKYPDNRNVPDAWRKLLDLFLVDYSSEQIAAFSNQYPDYPFQEELMESYQLANTLYFPYVKDGKWGFINKDHQIMIEPQFDWVEPFNNGIANVGKDQLYYFIDKKGELITQEGFEDAYKFSEELAVVERNGKLGAINRVGKVVIPFEYDDLGNESEGLVYAEKNGEYCYLNAYGEKAIDATFSDARTFENGRALVQKDQKYGIINKKGNYLIPPKYEQVATFTAQYYKLENDEAYWGILGISGDTLLPFEYDYIGNPQENRAVVFKEGNYGFIDTLGQIKVEIELTTDIISKELLEYKNHHVPKEVKGKIGLMDTLGNKKIPSIFQNIGFYDDLIPIIKEDLWGYCDTNTDLQIKYQYESAENFRDTLAIVKMNGFYGMINKEDIFRINPIYDRIEYLTPHYLWVENENGGRIIDLKGTPLFERFFKKIELYEKHWYQLIDSEGELIYYNLKDNVFLTN